MSHVGTMNISSTAPSGTSAAGGHLNINDYLVRALNMGASGLVSVFFSILGASILIFLLKAIGVFK